MSGIRVENLTFHYDGSYEPVFEGISFQLDTDWKLGLVGRNGRGKTTFLRLLMGEYEYAGTITKQVRFDYFPAQIPDKSQTVLEIMEQLAPAYELWKVCRELEYLKTDAELLYHTFSELSGGEQTKVLLAVLFANEDRFLLLDEPTNHLDRKTREIIQEYLKKKKGFLLVSHDRELLDACTDHILALNKTGAEVCQGNFSTWWENKNRREQHETAQNERLKTDIKRLELSAKQSGQWADKSEAIKIGGKLHKEHASNIGRREYLAEKSRKMQVRRKNLEKRREDDIQEKKTLLKDVETVDVLSMFPLEMPGKRLVNMDKVQLAYGDRRILENFCLQIESGDRIALTGVNGCGKSSVLKLLMKECLPQSGTVETAGGLRISYVPQDASFLQGKLRDYMEEAQLEESLFKAVLRKLDFDRTQFEKDMGDYSAGQKKKVLLARSLCEKAHLYIWDEPLNYIDVFSRMQVEELLLTAKPTLLFVEHDKVFTEKIATRVLEIEKR